MQNHDQLPPPEYTPHPLDLPSDINRSVSGTELFRQHPDLLITTLESGVLEDTTDGTAGTVSWHRTDRLGKHQRVAIVEFSLPDGSTLPAVIRQCYSPYSEISEDHPKIQKYYPKVYDALPIASHEPGVEESEMLAIEKIEGFHGDHPDTAFTEQFKAKIETPEGFEELCQDMFTALDELYDLPLDTTDIDPVAGHNVAYNTSTGHFQFFDIDTLRRSDAPHVQKFLRFVGNTLHKGRNSDENIAFATRMIQLYQDAHPDRELRFEYPPTEVTFFEAIEGTPAVNKEYIYPNKDGEHSEEYWKAFFMYQQQQGERAVPITKPPVLQKETKSGHYSSVMNPAILEAIRRNELIRIKELLAHRSISQESILDTQFFEQ